MKKVYAGFAGYVLLTTISCLSSFSIRAQETEVSPSILKLPHAEPLYFDLICGPGAHKGEREWNVGAEFRNTETYNAYPLLIEYEFTPVDRLGVEVEADFLLFKGKNATSETPKDQIESLRIAGQYSFFVSPKHGTSLAVGYTQQVYINSFQNLGKDRLVTGIGYNPFFIAAKTWRKNIHGLFFLSPVWAHDFEERSIEATWFVNSSFHYTIPGSKHFVGVEFNKEITSDAFQMTIRPQMKIAFNEHIAVGFAAGFPINQPGEGFSSFFRFIYEP